MQAWRRVELKNQVKNILKLLYFSVAGTSIGPLYQNTCMFSAYLYLRSSLFIIGLQKMKDFKTLQVA